jgi:Protein of unknown function (DUF3995)
LASLVGYVLAAVLVLLGTLHLLWALRIYFPFANEQALARAVVGLRGITRMPPRGASAFVGLLLLAAAGAAVCIGTYSDWVPALKIVLAPLGLLLSAVFLVRGIAGVLPAFERALPEQPFLKLNRRIYSPLCFLIGAAFLFLTIALPNWSWRLSAFFD